MADAQQSHAMTRLIKCLVAALVFGLVLLAPNHPQSLNLDALRSFPLELVALLLILWLIPGQARWGRVARIGVVALLVLSLIGRLADYATYVAFDRSFNSIVDWNLVNAGWLTLVGSIGWPLALAALVVTLLAIVAVALLLNWAAKVWSELPMHRLVRPWAFVALSISVAITVAEVGFHRQHMAYNPPGEAFTARLAAGDSTQWVSTLHGLKAFNQALEQDAFASETTLLSRLGANDVLIIFVESYGRSSFDNPFYAQTHVSTLQMAQQRLQQKGLAMRSGWLRAPMIGGQSWLSHATIASGLRIDNQGRYRMLIDSQRPSLYHYAQQAGFQTMAVMPGIRLDWPEAQYFGFDKILDAHNLGYQGQALNWVTMPDQYTLGAFDRLVLDQVPRKPVFAQIALISSHAPWVPIIPLIDWDDIGDGTVFNQWANQGDSPEEVWRDTGRVRDQFRQSVDYSLQVALSYAERQDGRSPLIIILGDHEPARFVSQRPGQEVAMHVIGTPEQIAAIDAWQWTPGLIPAQDLPVWDMDQFRDQFLNAYSDIAP